MDTTRFRTNQKLSKGEQDCVRQLILKATDELQDIQEQFTRLQNKLSTDISNYNIAIAPWKRVPEHIFRLIFLWCLPPSGVVIPGPGARTCVTLTAICSSWRKLALNTPELWQAVTVKFRYGHSDRAISVARQWLERAGNRARTLRIQTSTGNHEAIFDQLVLPFKFRELDIIRRDYHQSCHMTEKILSLPPERTQSLVALRVVTLEAERYTAWDSNAEVISPKDQCPFSNLQILSLCIEGSLMSHQSIATVIPWERLRRLWLRVENFSPPLFLNILQRCVALEELEVTMEGEAESELSVPSSITLPNLQRADLCFEKDGHPEVFFRSLVLPNIEEFSVHGYPLIYTSQSFADMAQRSGMDKLRRLFLDKGKEPHHLDHLLKYTPSLTRLEVRGKVVLDSQILEGLLKGQLGPNLEELVARTALVSGRRVGRLIDDLLYFRRTPNGGGVLDG